MARTKEFDPDTALQGALELFWRRGYEATSMADLVQHLGIGRASIYATFGSKHELYLKALDRYLQLRNPNPIELLSQPGPALPAVRALVQQYAEESACDEQRRGCLVVNAAVERLPGASAVTRARAQGELADDCDPRVLARFLLVVLQGLRVLGKGHPDPERLRDAAAQALTALK